MPWSCYNYSPIILTATVDLLSFAGILHNKNNAWDIFTTGKLMKEVNILMIKKVFLSSQSWDSNSHQDGQGYSCVTHTMPIAGRRAHSLSTAHHPGPHTPYLYTTNVCNLCCSIQLEVLTNIKVSHSVSICIREKFPDSYPSLLNAISALFLSPVMHLLTPWRKPLLCPQTQVKTMTSVNTRKNTVCKYMLFNAGIWSVNL